MNKVLLIVITATIIFGCGITDRKEGIKGKWVVVEYKYDWSDTFNMDGLDKAYMKERFKMHDEALEKYPGQMIMTMKDSVYIWHIPDGISESGTWELQADDSTIVYRFIRDGKYLPSGNDTLITTNSIIRELTRNTLEVYKPRLGITNVYKRLD